MPPQSGCIAVARLVCSMHSLVWPVSNNKLVFGTLLAYLFAGTLFQGVFYTPYLIELEANCL